MILSKRAKLLLGIGTAWMIVYPFLFMFGVLAMMLGMGLTVGSDGEPSPAFMLPFMAIFPLHFLTIFLSLALMAIYLIHVIKNKGGSETIRIILALGFFFMPFIAMPLYYYVYIWLDSPPDWALESKESLATDGGEFL